MSMLDETKATEFELIMEGLISAVNGLREGTVRRRISVCQYIPKLLLPMTALCLFLRAIYEKRIVPAGF